MIKLIKKIVGAVTPTKRKYTKSKNMRICTNEVLQLPKKDWYPIHQNDQ